jgi:hypothetical protein
MQGGGYDPSVSLLPQASSGGITPMQGGGHDSMATLLPAVNSIDPTIVPMKGGAGDDEEPADIIIKEAIKTAENAIKEATASTVAAKAKAAAEEAEAAKAKAEEAEAAKASASTAPLVLGYSINDVIGYMGQLNDPLKIPVAPFTVTVSEGSITPTATHPGLHTTIQELFSSIKSITDKVVVGHPYTFERRRIVDPKAKIPAPPGPTIPIGPSRPNDEYTIDTRTDSGNEYIEVQYVLTSASPASIIIAEATKVARAAIQEAAAKGMAASGSTAEEEPTKDEIITRLTSRNIGFTGGSNQCYKNSALQMLTHLEEFISPLLDLKSTIVPIPVLQEVIKRTYRESEPYQLEVCESSKTLKERLGCISLKNQEDPDEFIGNCIFEKLETAYETAGSPDKEFLKQLLTSFSIVVTDRLYSDACTTFVRNGLPSIGYMYKLPIEGVTIQSCIDNAVSCKKYDEDAMPKTGNITHYSTTINPVGKYVIISLKRFDNDQNKVNTSVSITKTVTIDSNTFTIEGIIVHEGPIIRGGHYIYLRKQTDTQWSVFDDSTHTTIDVIPDSANLVLNNPIALTPASNGYMFLYKRVGDTPPFDIDSIETTGTIKAKLRAMFDTKYTPRLVAVTVGRDGVTAGVPGSTKEKTYNKDVPLSTYIKETFLDNIVNTEQGNELYALLNNDGVVSEFIDSVTKYTRDFLNIDPTTDATANFLTYFKFHTGSATGGPRIVPPNSIFRPDHLEIEGGGRRRRKTLRLQARQKPGRRALSHKQVHHEQNENA